MNSEGKQQDINLKLFIKAVNEQFRKMNARLDELQSHLIPCSLGDK